jgi:molybdopterin-guanine dinucleotide biosynthesis protein A
MKIAAVIIAGGRSSRMGQEKAFSLLAGHTVLSHIIARIGSQVHSLVINANGDPERYGEWGLPVIRDILNVGTPLAGLHAALKCCQHEKCDWVLTVPSDTPFLPRDLVARLAASQSAAAVAASGGQSHYLTGLWHHDLLEPLEDAIRTQAVFRVKDWAAHCKASTAEWPAIPFDPFFNINTPEDLAEAERIAAEFAP